MGLNGRSLALLTNVLLIVGCGAESNGAGVNVSFWVSNVANDSPAVLVRINVDETLVVHDVFAPGEAPRRFDADLEPGERVIEVSGGEVNVNDFDISPITETVLVEDEELSAVVTFRPADNEGSERFTMSIRSVSGSSKD